MPFNRPPIIPAVMREPEAAGYLGMSLSSIRRARREGKGPRFVRLTDRALGYRRIDLDAWLEARTAQAAQPHAVAR